jgi:Zn-dependent peptidase ImmA (M78 family)
MPKASLSADLKIQTSPNGVIDLARDQIAALARKYQVSEIAMNYRLINLGFLSPI